MKHHHMGLIIAAALVGAPAHAANFNVVEAIRPLPNLPVLPLTLPGRPLPIPTSIPGPAIQLPGPIVPLTSIPGVIQVAPYVPAAPVLPVQKVQKGFFAASQKMFAAAPGQSAPSAQQLNAGFDAGSKASAPAVKADDGSVEVKKDGKKEEPKPVVKRRPIERSVVIPVPTLELEREIGI